VADGAIASPPSQPASAGPVPAGARGGSCRLFRRLPFGCDGCKGSSVTVQPGGLAGEGLPALDGHIDILRHQLDTTPNCPVCNELMLLSRTVPRLGGFPQLKTYQCKPCGVVFTEEDSGSNPISERARALYDEPCPRQ
jgi:hypothetical protein